MEKEISLDIEIKIVAFASDEYEEATILREEVLRKPLGLTYKKAELEDDHKQIQIVVYLESELIATCSLLPLNDKTLKMQRVAVKEKYQSQKIGTKLLKFCEKYVIENGYSEIYCHARDSAVRFYLRHNFLAEGDLFDEDGTAPHLRMRKILK